MKSQKDNIIIGIDTSCYTTSVAALSLDEKVIFNNKVLLEVKKDSKGLRQSEAVFQHIKNMELISKQIEAIEKNYKIAAVCVSSKPRPVKESYMPVFIVGQNFGKLLASIIKCPIYETTHQENHIYASLLNNKIKNKNRFISVHMSGGTTEILLVQLNEFNEYNIEIIAKTNDISFGQLIDRVGVQLGYGFPSGKYIDANALKCSQKIEVGLKTSVKNGDMNLSGIENQINKIIKDYSTEYISKLVMDTISRYLEKSLTYVCQKLDVDEVVFAGGVSASQYINKDLTYRLNKHNIKSYFTEAKYATDNAVGCAIVGKEKLLRQT